MNVPHLNGFLQISAIGLALVALPAVPMDSERSPGMRASGSNDASLREARDRLPAATSSQLFMRYREYVGSDADTRSLIQGLRYGELISLGGGQAGSGTTKFLPPTRAMGWGSIDRALSLVQHVLASAGIAQPTAAQLRVALVGGSLVAADGSAVKVGGVLSLRSQGMGWGEIARALDAPAAAGTANTVQRVGGNGGRAATRAGLQQEPAQSGRVRATFVTPHSNRPAGVDVDQGAMVAAQGMLMGNGIRMPDERSNAMRFSYGDTP